MLVDSFNRMTAELKANKDLLERSNRELVATNKRLDEERALIAAVHASVAAGVISVDSDGLVLTCNRAATEMLGQREDEVIGRRATCDEAWSDPERGKLAELLEEALPWSGRVSREVRLARRRSVEDLRGEDHLHAGRHRRGLGTRHGPRGTHRADRGQAARRLARRGSQDRPRDQEPVDADSTLGGTHAAQVRGDDRRPRAARSKKASRSSSARSPR